MFQGQRNSYMPSFVGMIFDVMSKDKSYSVRITSFVSIN